MDNLGLIDCLLNMPANKGSPDVKLGHATTERAKKAPATRRKTAPSPAATQPLQTVVGMVATAGGLEAFKQFFQAMPADSGIAFVLIPHLDPKHESLMAPLLGKQTAMPVTEAQDGQRLEADHVYVIPPNHYLTLHQGIIQLSAPPDQGAGQTAPAPFLRSVNSQLRDKVDELEDSNNDMTNLLASVDNATLFLGVDRTIQRFTPSAMRLFNLIATDVGRPIDHITARVDDPELLRDIDAVLQDLAPCAREVSRDNEQWFLRRITPYRTAANRISGVVLTLTDVTPLKRAELELRNLTAHLEQRVSEGSAQLQHERNFIDAILNTVDTLIMVVDPEGRLVSSNASCDEISGYDFAEFVGGAKWQDLIPSDEKEGVRRVIERLLSGEDYIKHENHFRHRDGSLRLIGWRNSVMKDPAGQVQFVIGTGIDITEQRRAENLAQENLEEASRLQRLQTANELATLLAHEINQPLAAIATYAATGLKLLQYEPLEQDKLTRNLEQISQQSLRAGETLRHLRAFVSRGRVDPVPLDVNVLVGNACALMEPKARSRGIKLVLKLDDALPQVMGVGVHIEQVLFNLMRNAIDAIRDARMKSGSITLKMRLQEGMARISVFDSGPGLDAEQAEKVFEPLSSRKKYGLGVGLRISRSLIEAHDGRLWVEAHTGGGIFHFTLPLAP